MSTRIEDRVTAPLRNPAVTSRVGVWLEVVAAVTSRLAEPQATSTQEDAGSAPADGAGH